MFCKALSALALWNDLRCVPIVEEKVMKWVGNSSIIPQEKTSLLSNPFLPPSTQREEKQRPSLQL